MVSTMTLRDPHGHGKQAALADSFETWGGGKKKVKSRKGGSYSSFTRFLRRF